MNKKINKLTVYWPGGSRELSQDEYTVDGNSVNLSKPLCAFVKPSNPDTKCCEKCEGFESKGEGSWTYCQVNFKGCCHPSTPDKKIEYTLQADPVGEVWFNGIRYIPVPHHPSPEKEEKTTYRKVLEAMNTPLDSELELLDALCDEMKEKGRAQRAREIVDLVKEIIDKHYKKAQALTEYTTTFSTHGAMGLCNEIRDNLLSRIEDKNQ